MQIAQIIQGPPKILIYSEVGVGKTAEALTLGERAEVLDFDNGLRTAVSLKDQFTEQRLKVNARQFIETDPMSRASAFKTAKEYIYSLPSEIKNGRYPYQALIIDSLSSFAEAGVAQIMYNSGQLGKNPEIQHWGLAFTEIKNVMATLRSLPIVLVVLAHEQVKTIGKGADAENKLEIAISGKNLPSQICRYFDEIWYMRAKAEGAGRFKRVFQTVSDGIKVARSRSCLPNDTDASVGMWEIIKKLGYEPPKVEAKSGEGKNQS